MMAVVFFTAHEKGFKFYAQPQTGAYSCFFLICATFSFSFSINVEDVKERPLMLQAVLPVCPNKPSVFVKFRPLALGPSSPHASGSKLHINEYSSNGQCGFPTSDWLPK